MVRVNFKWSRKFIISWGSPKHHNGNFRSTKAYKVIGEVILHPARQEELGDIQYLPILRGCHRAAHYSQVIFIAFDREDRARDTTDDRPRRGQVTQPSWGKI